MDKGASIVAETEKAMTNLLISWVQMSWNLNENEKYSIDATLKFSTIQINCQN